MTNNFINNYILKFVLQKNNKVNNNKLQIILNYYPNIKYYLQNLLDHYNSFNEIIYRILYNEEKQRYCPICHKYLKYYGKHKWAEHCSTKCASLDKNVQNKYKQTCLNKYNVEHAAQLNTNNFKVNNPLKNEKIKKHIQETCLYKYNVKFAWNNQNQKNTLLKKYGVDNIRKSDYCKQKIKQTLIEKYNNENYTNLKKSKQTCLEKYGSEYYFTSKDCKEKLINKFNVDNYRKTLESKQKTSEYIKTHQQDIRRKVINTCLKKYGVDNVAKCQFIKDKIDWKKQKEKEYITKKKNNSFNISKPEDQSYELLKSKYPDVQKQYRSEAYPFNCDFYIPSLDLYIECNYHWTHGFHPYDPNSIEDQKQLELWKSKSTKFYDNAINTWTIRDVNKRHTAKENNLNWIEFFSILKLNKWLENKYEI